MNSVTLQTSRPMPFVFIIRAYKSLGISSLKFLLKPTKHEET